MTKTWLTRIEAELHRRNRELDALNIAVEELRTAADLLVRDGRAEGIEPDGPLGRWLDAQARALKGFAGALDGQAERIETVLSEVQAANRTELSKLAMALEAARESVRQGEQAVARARTAQFAATSHQQEVAQGMSYRRKSMPVLSLAGSACLDLVRMRGAGTSSAYL